MRSFPIVLVVAACGSGKTSDPPSPVTAPPSPKVVATPDAAAAAAPAAPAAVKCFGPSLSGTLTTFVADDKAATLCFDIKDPDNADKPAAHRCVALDLAIGAFHDGATEPPKRVEPFTFKYGDDGHVDACTNGACVTLDLPKIPKNDPPTTYAIHASEDGTKLITTGDGQKGIYLFDAKTGKRTKLIPFHLPDGCLADAFYVGDVIYSVVSVCAGPGGTGYFLKPDGKDLGKIEETYNVYGGTPVHVDGDRWAFPGWGGGGFPIWDVKTVKQVASVTQPDDNCSGGDCTLFDTTGLDVQTLVKTPGGKLVTVDGSGVTVVDAQTGKIGMRTLFPVCPAKP